MARNRLATTDRDSLPPQLTRNLSREQLPALDGLRAIAAYLVVFYHLGIPWIPGGLGVLAFFVLSGFLITWLLLREQESRGTVSLRLFYLRRALRIFPAFYVYAFGILLLLSLTGKRIVWAQTIASLCYVNNYYQAIAGDPGTALSHTWSLAIEEQFYLVAPAAFLALYRRGTLARRLVLAIGCVWICRWTLVAIGVPQHYIYEAFETRADHLMIGCLLAVALRGRLASGTFSAFCAHEALPALTVGALVLSAMLGYRFGPTYRDVVGFVVDPLLVAVLIVQLIAWSDRTPWSWLDRPAIRYLGRISYSIYLYQQIMPTLVDAALRRQPVLARLAVTLGGVTLAAGVSYQFVERPFLRLKERLSRHPRAAPNPVVAPLSATVP